VTYWTQSDARRSSRIAGSSSSLANNRVASSTSFQASFSQSSED
jgi:hypothetical protein